MSKIEDKGSAAAASPKGRRRKVAAIAAGLVLVQAIGGGAAWASGSLSADVAPALQATVAEDGEASPSEAASTQLPADPADAAAVEVVSTDLAETERAAAMARLSAKGDGPSAGQAAPAPAGLQVGSAAAGSDGPAKRWGIVRGAWDEEVLVTPARDEVVVVTEARIESVLVASEKVDYIEHPATYKTIKEKVGVKHVCRDCGYTTTSDSDIDNHAATTGHIIRTVPVYEEKQVIDKEAWTETVITPAKYKEVYHPAVTETRHHDAVYKTVHHDAVWGWI